MLPEHFAFSQASLQDYADCPRRFQLRYVLDTRWPAARETGDESSAEWERRAQRGATFHHLVHQHTVGIPAEVLSTTLEEMDDLQLWWHAYLTAPPQGLPAARRSEVHLSTSLGGQRLLARYDLLAVDPGQRAVIVDWKTSGKLPRRVWLERRWQTLVYRFVLAEAGAQLNGGTPWLPQQVELVYWFASFPGQVVHFPYDATQHAETGEALSKVIAEILSNDQEVWHLAEDPRTCRYCIYRTFCGRERTAEEDAQVEVDLEQDSFGFDLDLEQIAEIEF